MDFEIKYVDNQCVCIKPWSNNSYFVYVTNKQYTFAIYNQRHPLTIFESEIYVVFESTYRDAYAFSKNKFCKYFKIVDFEIE